MPFAYPIRRLDRLKPRVQLDEHMGSKEKFWLQHPKTNRRVLWKMARPNTGEDWSEKVAYELAKLLHIPSARVDMAMTGEAHGVVCWDFLYRRGNGNPPALIHGNELLRETDPDYPHDQYYQVSKHTVQAVHDALGQVEPPLRIPEHISNIADAFDAFVGYLLLDALIGNTDRHHENWGVIATQAKHGSPSTPVGANL